MESTLFSSNETFGSIFVSLFLNNFENENFEEFSEELLKSLLGECVNAFEKLPLENDIEIMRNILCSGIWTKLDAKKKEKKEN